MKKLLLCLLSVCLLCACNEEKDDPVTKIQYIVILDSVSFNIDEEAYLDLTKYFEYLETYYATLENVNEQIDKIKSILEELLSQYITNKDDVIDYEELEKAIEQMANSYQNPDSSEPNIPTLKEMTQAPLTLFVYLVADTNIKTDLRNNIKHMFKGLSDMDKRATLLVYWDGGGSDTYFETSPCILKFETDGLGNVNGVASRDSMYTIRQVADFAETVKSYPSMKSTDKSAMTAILKDMASFAPTDRYGFVAGSHGSAWLNSIYGYKASRAFGQDGAGDFTITTPDMADAIENAGLHFDFLLFDACMMGTVEVCYDFREVVDYLIVSALDVPAPGFPYQHMLSSLYEGEVSGYVDVCDTYVNYYRTYSGGWGSMALVDCKQMEGLASAIKEQITAHKDVIADYNPIGKLQHYGLNTSATGFKYVSFDMGQFISVLNDGVLPESFSAQLDKTILHKTCLENTTYYRIEAEKFCGLGMYIPLETRPNWNVYYETIDWYDAAGWNQVNFNWN